MNTVVAGVGNPDRGDDGFGLAVIDRLSTDTPAGVRLARCRGDMAALIETISEAEFAIVVDAMVAGGAVGGVRRMDATTPLRGQSVRFASTHSVNLAEAIELARALGKLPPRLLVYGVEAGQFGLGAPMSAAVAIAVEKVAAAIRHDCR